MIENPYLKGRHMVFPTMFRMLYCCWLRCKETRILTRENVHLDQKYLDILQSKGPKSRRVYISSEFAGYLADYDKQINRLLPDHMTFFPNREDRPYSASCLEQNFLQLWYAAFPKKKDSGMSIRHMIFGIILFIPT